MIDATIHLRVPAELKARWVRESRDEGARLSDWIVQKVESTMSEVKKGGTRPGSGRPALEGGRRVNVTLDEATIVQAKALGSGNLSAGVREAVRRILEKTMNEKIFKVQIYDTRTRKQDLFTQVVAENALAAIEKAGEFKVRGDYTSVRRLDYWQEKNPDSPELSMNDNAHYQHNASGTAGIAAWRIR
jgi:hypothetical protein